MPSLTPGESLKFQKNISLGNSSVDISDLVIHPTTTLSAMREASIEQEKAIIQKLETVIAEWTTQAAETQRLKKAMEYLRVMPVDHTSNVWKTNRYGRHEISNMVYKMTWSVNERTVWDHKADKSVTVAWVLTWDLHFNTVHNPDYSGPGWKIAGQSNKVFAEKTDMEKYLQGRIKAYSHLFTELSPPIPQDHARRFFVNGHLLPGYTVEQSMIPDTNTVDALLACLDDDDPTEGGSGPAAIQEQPAKAPKPHTPKTHQQTKKKSTMTR